jgi:CRP-like cAMP-binding protein
MGAQLEARIRSLLARSALLGRLPDGVLDMLAQRGQLRRYVRGEFIFRRGDASESIVLVVSGSAKLAIVSVRAREVVLSFVGAGDAFGEIAALDGGKRVADAIVLEDTELFIIQTRDLVPALMDNPNAMMEIVRALCRRARVRAASFEDLTLDMGTRFARGLLRLARQLGRRCDDGIRVELPVSQEELGNYLGLARANVSRQIGRVKNMGLIKTDGARIIVTDEKGLARLAEATPDD